VVTAAQVCFIGHHTRWPPTLPTFPFRVLQHHYRCPARQAQTDYSLTLPGGLLLCLIQGPSSQRHPLPASQRAPSPTWLRLPAMPVVSRPTAFRFPLPLAVASRVTHRPRPAPTQTATLDRKASSTSRNAVFRAKVQHSTWAVTQPPLAAVRGLVVRGTATGMSPARAPTRPRPITTPPSTTCLRLT
jgi:hypothetical protein